ncbi:tyrosine-type recombinase/integrase [Mycobacterium nebraskense]|uniref:tyrosine-type recombinase/integrase n=1 Tax=Mycobacterium nebraskense TaxID=244292 RepID=UPI00069B1822|nr:tyrosine-type recombinase/integrase [Mycobacterium nebraskense]
MNADVLQAFLLARRVAESGYLTSARGVVPMLKYRRTLGVMPEPGAPTPVGPVELLLSEYRRYLAAERGLAALSVDRYLTAARLFLSELPAPLDASLQALSAAQVTEFLVAEACRRRVWAAKSLVNALRSLLRFLHVTGRTPRRLLAAVPAVAGWGLGVLPRAVDAAHVAALLGSCDRSSSLGCRDYAILMLLSRLGLRNGEVAHLQLDDIDWRAGQMLIRGKGNHNEVLPLPDDVGRALVDYLIHAWPRGIDSRAVFVIGQAPFTPLSLSGITSIVVAACDRGRVARIGPHRLRHSVPSDLLARGAPLAEVGQLLRHRAESTTAVYAKLDHRALGALVRPWPDSP